MDTRSVGAEQVDEGSRKLASCRENRLPVSSGQGRGRTWSGGSAQGSSVLPLTHEATHLAFPSAAGPPVACPNSGGCKRRPREFPDLRCHDLHLSVSSWQPFSPGSNREEQTFCPSHGN